MLETEVPLTLPKEAVFDAFRLYLSDQFPGYFFDFLWRLQEMLTNSEPVDTRLQDQTILQAQVMNAQSMVDSKLAVLRKTTEKTKSSYELKVRDNLAGSKPTIDHIKATLYERYPDYVKLADQLVVFEVLSEYMKSLMSLCLSRQITTKELSERDRSRQ